jgi:hypothetical protein
MNFPMNHLSDGEALLAVREVAAPYRGPSSHLC